MGIIVDEPNKVLERFAHHQYVFHRPVIFVPRLTGEEFVQVAEEMGRRLQHCRGPLAVFLPEGGTSSYSTFGNPLHNPESDKQFFTSLEDSLPAIAKVKRLPFDAVHPTFIKAAGEQHITMIRATETPNRG